VRRLPLPPPAPPLTCEQMAQRAVGNRLTDVTAAITISAYDPNWPTVYSREETKIRAALGAQALAIEHVGSTAVPGLAAKNRIDIDLVVADPADEAAYVPPLEAAGYGCGLGSPHADPPVGPAAVHAFMIEVPASEAYVGCPARCR
jgi:GrpB-like predicted nucleotidyltransferase (UPF0157 family)